MAQSFDCNLNQVAMNWRQNQSAAPSSGTPQFLKISNNARNTGLCNEAGDLWIDAGADKIGKYEDIHGNWVAMTPIAPIDNTPPATPSALSSQPAAHTVTLAWGASSDAESGVYCYSVNRDGAFAGSTKTLTFTDTGLVETHSYQYTVSAVNGNGIASPAAAIAAQTAADNQPPHIAAIDQYAGAANLVVVFDEPVEKASAEIASHYAIDNAYRCCRPRSRQTAGAFRSKSPHWRLARAMP